MRVTDPRQQTMLTNQMLTPVMNKPTMPSQKVPVFPSIGGIGGGTVPTQPPAPVSDQTLTPVMPKPTQPTEEAPKFASVVGIGGGVVPTAEETPDSFEEYLSTLTTDDLDNLDLSGVNLDNIDVPSY